MASLDTLVPFCLRDDRKFETKTTKKTSAGRDRIGVLNTEGFAAGDRIMIGDEVGIVVGTSAGFIAVKTGIGQDWDEGTVVAVCNHGPTSVFEREDWVVNRYTLEIGKLEVVTASSLGIVFDGETDIQYRVPDNYDVIAPKPEPGSVILIHSMQGTSQDLNGKTGTLDQWVPVASSWKVKVKEDMVNVPASCVHVKSTKAPVPGAKVLIHGSDNADVNNQIGSVEGYAAGSWTVKLDDGRTCDVLQKKNLQVVRIEATPMVCRDAHNFDSADFFCPKCGCPRPSPIYEEIYEEEPGMCGGGEAQQRQGASVNLVAHIEGVSFRKMMENAETKKGIEHGLKGAVLGALGDFTEDNIRVKFVDLGEKFDVEIEVIPPDGIDRGAVEFKVSDSLATIENNANSGVQSAPGIGDATTAPIVVKMELKATSCCDKFKGWVARKTACLFCADGDNEEVPEEDKTYIAGMDVTPVTKRVPKLMDVRPEKPKPNSVAMQAQITGMNFDAIGPNPECAPEVEAKMKQTVLESMKGRVVGLGEQDIAILHTEGEQTVDIIVTPPQGVEAKSVAAGLFDSQGFQDRGRENLKSSEAINTASNGEVDVVVSLPRIVRPASKEHVIVHVKIEGIKYGMMIKERKIVRGFEKAIKDAVIEMFPGMREEGISLDIDDGIVVTIDIEPAGGISPNVIKARLDDQEEFVEKICTNLKKVPGISKVKSGQIAAHVDSAKVVEPRPRGSDRVHILGMNTCSYKGWQETKKKVVPKFIRGPDEELEFSDEELDEGKAKRKEEPPKFFPEELVDALADDDQWFRVKVFQQNLDHTFMGDVMYENEAVARWPVMMPDHMRKVIWIVSLKLSLTEIDMSKMMGSEEANEQVQATVKELLVNRIVEITPGFTAEAIGIDWTEEGYADVKITVPPGQKAQPIANLVTDLKDDLAELVEKRLNMMECIKQVKYERFQEVPKALLEEEGAAAAAEMEKIPEFVAIQAKFYEIDVSMAPEEEIHLSCYMVAKIEGMSFQKFCNNPKIGGEKLVEKAMQQAVADKIGASWPNPFGGADLVITERSVHVTLSDGLLARIVVTPPSGVSPIILREALKTNQKPILDQIVLNVKKVRGIRTALKPILTETWEQTPEVDVPAAKDAHRRGEDIERALQEEAMRKGNYVDFDVQIRIMEGQHDMGFLPDDRCGMNLRITELADEGGVVPEFNKEYPSRALVNDDRIVKIQCYQKDESGTFKEVIIAGKSELLMKALEQPGVATWTIRRQAEEASDALNQRLAYETPKDVKAQIRELGVEDAEIDKCDDNDDVKQALIDMLIHKVREQEEFELEMELEKHKGIELGASIKPDVNDKTYIITNLKDKGAGEKDQYAFAKWNECNPKKRVRIGDRIVEMNGVKNDMEALQFEIDSFKDSVEGMPHWFTIRKSKVSAALDKAPEEVEVTQEDILAKQDELVECIHRVDNSEYRSETKGLGYYTSPSFKNPCGDGDDDVAPWGSLVLARSWDKDFVVSGKRYLPKAMDGKPVLYREEWRYEPEIGNKPVSLRTEPGVSANKAPYTLQVGEVFLVSEERKDKNGVIFLKLADGRGWIFDHVPGKGDICVRVKAEGEPLTAGCWVEVVVSLETNNANPIKVPSQMKGRVIKFDEEGDAQILFDGIRSKQWVKNSQFVKMKVIPAPVVEEDGDDEEEKKEKKRKAYEAALMAELQLMKVSDLKRRARARGVGEAQINGADDAPNPKAALIGMIIRAEKFLRPGSHVTVLQDFEAVPRNGQKKGIIMGKGKKGRVAEAEDNFIRIKIRKVKQTEWVDLVHMAKMKFEAPPELTFCQKHFGCCCCKVPEESDLDASEDEEEPDVSDYHEGSRVVIHGMERKDPNDSEDEHEALNGREGRIIKRLKEKKAWEVYLNEDHKEIILSKNLRHAELGICEKGHLLRPLEFKGQYSCSCCNRIYPRAIYECGQCDYGLCSHCMHTFVATCKKGHILRPLGLSMDNGWVCNGKDEEGGCKSKMTAFKQSKGINRFRCADCDYDLCEGCCRAVCEVQNTIIGMRRDELDEMRAKLPEKENEIRQLQADMEYLQKAEADEEEVQPELSWDEVLEDVKDTDMDKPVPPARKMLLWGLLKTIEQGPPTKKDAPGYFEKQDKIKEFEAWKIHEKKSKEECKKEYMEEWFKQKQAYCLKKPPQFDVGNEVKHKINDIFGIVTCVEPNVLWLMFAGDKIPRPKLRASWKHVPKETWHIGQDVKVKNNGDDMWLTAIITNLDPLECRPTFFDKPWQWDVVEPLKKPEEPLRCWDQVTVLRGDHKGRTGRTEQWLEEEHEWEVKLDNGKLVKLPLKNIQRRGGININDHVVFIDGPHKGDEGIVERWSPAWSEWEIRLHSGTYVFASPRILATKNM